MTTRGRRLLLAQLAGPGEPLEPEPPPEDLSPDAQRAWRDIVSAVPPGILQRQDGFFFLDTLASQLAAWRAGWLDRREWTRSLYRWLGNCFVPMAARRRLLFPEARPSRSKRV